MPETLSLKDAVAAAFTVARGTPRSSSAKPRKAVSIPHAESGEMNMGRKPEVPAENPILRTLLRLEGGGN